MPLESRYKVAITKCPVTGELRYTCTVDGCTFVCSQLTEFKNHHSSEHAVEGNIYIYMFLFNYYKTT